MRICLFDSINERHVAASLGRALAASGHHVCTTGAVWRGSQLPNEAADRARLAAVVDGVINQRPDVVLVMRSAALRPEQVDRLRERGAFTIAWFADDPVLYAAHTARVAPHYDLTLHTATAPTLELYESSLGVRGIAFPFWADQMAFPQSYDPRRCDLDLVFIGNTHTRVKRWRYDVIAALPLACVVYGKIAVDPARIHAGVAVDDAALARAALRGRLGLNISQRFSDYAGTRFDFPELVEFGEYSLPSRIVQLAALGVPTISLVGSDQAVQTTKALFPPVILARDSEQLTDTVGELRENFAELTARSRETHAWYARHYTAMVRAQFLERLVAAPGELTSLPADQRAIAFLDTPSQSDGRGYM